MMISHNVLRMREPGMTRLIAPSSCVVTTGFAPVIAVSAVIATFPVDGASAPGCPGVFAAFLAYLVLSRHQHLVANSPGEEFAALAAAETNRRRPDPGGTT